MKVDRNTFQEIHHPIYVLEEGRLRKNLELIASVAERTGVEIILAFKAYALWKTFPVFREYIHATTASSLYEAMLGYQEFGAKVHCYTPAYTVEDMPEMARMSSHLVLNSLSQYERLADVALQANPELLLGLRVNPEYSEVETLLYNPCAPGTRFGVRAALMPEELPDGITGLHVHCHCESGADVFVRSLSHIEDKFAKWFPQVQWINFGGGHLMTRADYDVELLVKTLKDFRDRYPWLHVIMEPGSAFGWQTGPLVAQVVDVVEDEEIKTAVLNVSFTCHMPDCLEMPYMPVVRGAKTVERDSQGSNIYRLGGCSCLSGDWMGSWEFDHELQIGENIIFEDMLHYTTVKTNMFNGISHPSIGFLHEDGEMELLREYTYDDYRSRMD
jgi:carboxynorspermidine decarboxylase